MTTKSDGSIDTFVDLQFRHDFLAYLQWAVSNPTDAAVNREADPLFAMPSDADIKKTFSYVLDAKPLFVARTPENASGIRKFIEMRHGILQGFMLWLMAGKPNPVS